jgi:hypothetical protein
MRKTVIFHMYYEGVENKGHKIVTDKATQNNIIHGIRSTWFVEYCY